MWSPAEHWDKATVPEGSSRDTTALQAKELHYSAPQEPDEDGARFQNQKDIFLQTL